MIETLFGLVKVGIAARTFRTFAEAINESRYGVRPTVEEASM